MIKQLSLNLAAQFVPLLFKAQSNQHLSILIYHRVLAQHDPMSPDQPTIQWFDAQMRLLRNHFHPLPLLEALERVYAGTLPARAICVTFDDGYADNELYALPVLKRYHIPATVFVSTGFLNGGRMWNDSIIETIRNFKGQKLDLSDLDLGYYSLDSIAERLTTIESIIRRIKHLDPQFRSTLVREIEKRVTFLPNDLMLTDEQVRSLARNGVSIGAHTVNHPILCSVSSEIARREIRESKLYLEDLLQGSIDLFAYPNGKRDLDYRDEHRDIVKELGFKAAVSTHWGVSTSESDRFQLPRFTPWDRGELRFAIRLLTGHRQVDPLIGRQALQSDT